MEITDYCQKCGWVAHAHNRDTCQARDCGLSDLTFQDEDDRWPPPETRMLGWVVPMVILAVVFLLSGLAAWILP